MKQACIRSLLTLAYFLQEQENPVKRQRLIAVQNSDEAVQQRKVIIARQFNSSYVSNVDKYQI